MATRTQVQAPGAAQAVSPMQKFNMQIRGVNAQQYLTSVLGKKKDQFVTSLISVVAANEALQACEPMSLVYTALKATALNLPIDPSLALAAILPYKDTKAGVTNAQFQIQRDGWVELLQRTGKVITLVNLPVHEGELVHANKFTDEYVFDESKRTSNKVIGYMAYVKLNTGGTIPFEKTVYWTTEECLAHGKKYSQTYKKGYGLWVDNPEAMCLKTVLKHLIKKYCPKSPELLQAINTDQAVYNSNGDADWQDNPEANSPTDLAGAIADRKENMRGTQPETQDMP